MTIFKYALIRGLRSPASLIFNLAIPIILMFFSGLWEGDNARGYYLVALMLMFGSFAISRGILNDRAEGTITRILSGPTTTFRYLSQNLLACMVPMTFVIIAIVTIGSILYNWQLSLSIFLALCYTVFAASFVSFSFAWSCLFKTKEVSFSVLTIVSTFIATLGGLMVPLEFLPNVLRFIGAAFPAFWASNGMEILLENGVQTEYWMSLLVMLLFAVIYLLYGGKRRII